jgi:hypothetical protein
MALDSATGPGPRPQRRREGKDGMPDTGLPDTPAKDSGNHRLSARSAASDSNPDGWPQSGDDEEDPNSLRSRAVACDS